MIAKISKVSVVVEKLLVTRQTGRLEVSAVSEPWSRSRKWVVKKRRLANLVLEKCWNRFF